MKRKSKDEQNGALVGEKKWYKNVTAVVVLVGGVVGVITGLVALSQKWIDWHRQTPEQNVEFVLDSSAAMNAPFEGGTKLEAAIRAVGNYLHGGTTKAVADKDNLAFRVFGGACNGDNTKLVVDFSVGNSRAIEKAAGKLKFSGETTLANAVVQATGDFNPFKGKSKRIIVITGGEDTCHKDDAISIIQTRLNDMAKAGEKIEIDLRFIGLGLSPQAKQQLTNLAKASGGEADFADTFKELDRALIRFARVEPVVNDINHMGKILDDVVQQESVIISSLNDDKFTDAESKLADARRTLKQSDRQFEDLGHHQGDDQFRKYFQQMYELAKTNREIQTKMLDLAENIIEKGKAGDNDARNRTYTERNKLVDQYNRNVVSINNLIKQVHQELENLETH